MSFSDGVSVDRALGPYRVLLFPGSIWKGIHTSLTRWGLAGTSGRFDLSGHESAVVSCPSGFIIMDNANSIFSVTKCFNCWFLFVCSFCLFGINFLCGLFEGTLQRAFLGPDLLKRL